MNVSGTWMFSIYEVEEEEEDVEEGRTKLRWSLCFVCFISLSLPLSSSLCALGARVFSYVFCRSIAVFSAAKTLSCSLLADVVIVTSFLSFFSCLR
jgi:hypothetical protein